jgi:hypothetical protein
VAQSAQAFVKLQQFQLATDILADVPGFEVTAQVGGNLGGAAARLGRYELDKFFNGAPAMKNENGYIMFYGGDGDGWQWVTGYNQWAGDGPLLSTVPSPEDFVRHMQFALSSDPVVDVADLEVVARTGGNLGDEANRIGVYKLDKMFNGAPAMRNENGLYVIFYSGSNGGWYGVRFCPPFVARRLCRFLPLLRALTMV